MIYVDKTGASSPIEKPGFYPVYDGELPIPNKCQQVVTDRLQWHVEGYWTQLYKLAPLPLYSAGEWLELVGLGASQQPTLIYLRLQLNAAGKQSPKLDQIEAYLNQVLGVYALDNNPRCDWGQPPISYYDAVKEAAEQLMG